jgi:ABC-type dipeptide/oligopeptide/nickel transport system permease component
MALTLLVAVFTVLGSLMADIAYGIVDHRVQLA